MKKCLSQRGLAVVPLMLVLALLVAAIPITTNLVKQNQDKRSSAADVTSTAVPVVIGSPYKTNSSACKAVSGVCATFSKALTSGTSCGVTGYTSTGTVKTGLCGGTTKTACCTGIVGQVGQKCKNGVNGECIQIGDKWGNNNGSKGASCSIPGSLINGMVSLGLCAGDKSKVCCVANNSSCKTVGQVIGCDGSAIKVCAVDDSSGVFGYRTQNCSSGQACSGSGASAECAPKCTGTGLAKVTVDTSCSDNNFRYMTYTCTDGYTRREGSDTSCKSQDLWTKYAVDFCNSHEVCPTKISPTSTPGPVSTKVDGVCGTLIDTCVQGKNAPFSESTTQYLWDCVGINGGTTASCTKDK